MIVQQAVQQLEIDPNTANVSGALYVFNAGARALPALGSQAGGRRGRRGRKPADLGDAVEHARGVRRRARGRAGVEQREVVEAGQRAARPPHLPHPVP